MRRTDSASYNIVVRNRPGELAKLTKLLSDAGINVTGLRIANLGDKASIEFRTPRALVRRAAPRGRTATARV